MRISFLASIALSCALPIWATILQNGQIREDPYPGQAANITLDNSWRTYDANAEEIAYKGRWDSRHISWWSAPGIKIGFTGTRLAVSFGESTSDGVLLAYRVGSLDWQFSNVTADATYQFVTPDTFNGIHVGDNNVFELRGIHELGPRISKSEPAASSLLTSHTVQIAGISVAQNASLSKPQAFDKRVEIIGGSLASGQFATYEAISGWAFLFAEGLGNAEYTITAYPGVCLADMKCYGGGVHGMPWFWHRASDPGVRAQALYGDDPERFDVNGSQPADLVIIQMGGNDYRKPNEISGDDYYHDYVRLVDDIIHTWPRATIVLMSQWGEWTLEGTEYVPSTLYKDETKRVHDHFKEHAYVRYFETRGILQHNDIDPKNHPTDVGHVKIASHLLQWTRIMMRWDIEPTGEVQHGTLYWNDQQEY
ncbi:SGNH hydrolase-type esterase domain-containing protein [Aspergillus ambiguus]|uniref:SGNH/GDSL hydrolase family protein n=1 Tax=Aspergillus ambiguus TaxID=176160 RepID=UPI003CCCCA8F